MTKKLFGTVWLKLKRCFFQLVIYLYALVFFSFVVIAVILGTIYLVIKDLLDGPDKD